MSFVKLKKISLKWFNRLELKKSNNKKQINNYKYSFKLSKKMNPSQGKKLGKKMKINLYLIKRKLKIFSQRA